MNIQCAIPVFDRLFDERHDEIIQDLLFLCAHWHALAKLRLHTDYTLTFLEEVTAALGDKLRLFQSHICMAYDTFELPREAAARQRREVIKQCGESSKHLDNGRRRKTFNLNTYKHHALGDYVHMIRTYGTCDSYSTELVCCVVIQVMTV